MRRIIRWAAAGVGLAAISYGAYVCAAWHRYGSRTAKTPDEADALLDQFMPDYDVAERHHIHVAAPHEITLAAATQVSLAESAIVRTIFRAREVILRARPDASARPTALLDEVESLGWRRLAEVGGREIVLGAATQPWMADVVFRGLSPDEFASFREPNYVKIIWTLRADPVDTTGSIFRTETRVATTDASARRQFRWYWARFSPGILLIRRMLLGQVKREAERRARLLG